ncbi:hypothetical protein [Agathobacter sp.]
MVRDFSDESKAELLRLVSEVENEKWCDFTDWVGDKWYSFEEWIGRLNIKNYINDVNSYHKKVIDKNNATKDNIEEIFRAVKNVNSAYTGTFSSINVTLKNWNSYIKQMSEIVEPSHGNFTVSAMQSSLDGILDGITKNNTKLLENRMCKDIGGELVFDEDLIYEYMKKDPNELTKEEKEVLINVIVNLEDAVTVYESAAKVGTDNLGAELAQKVSWVRESEKYNSFSAVSAHYSNIYVSLLNYISEQDEESNTFAASLAKIGNGESSISFIGVEYENKIKSIFGGATVAAYLAKYKSEHSEQYFGKLEAEEKAEYKAGSDMKDFNENNEARLKQKEKFANENETVFKDENGNKIADKDAPNFYEKNMTIGEIKASNSVSASIYDGKFDTFNDSYVEAVMGKAEAHAEISAGVYKISSKDGTKKFSPGVNAEIGASATALDINWDQQWIGDKDLGINSNVEVSTGKVGAKVGTTAQIFGENGKLDAQLGVEAKAEAILAEAKGKAGVNVLGGEVGVSGSVNFGIGAHADVGYKDGVFKFDVGASFGVGASVGTEIDLGGMVDTVCDKASSAWKDIKKLWR